MPQSEILDVGDAAQVAAYERAFFAAFQRAKGNRLIRTLWRWDDDAQRVATAIPYTDQIVYLQRDEDGAIGAAVSANVAMRDFQGKAFGFAPEPEQARWAEIITFFAAGRKSLALRRELIGICLQDLARRGFTAAYATTAARPMRSYLRYYGVEVVATAEINGETRHFMRYTLPPPSIG